MWWWYQQKRAQSFRLVLPPRERGVRWWISHAGGGLVAAAGEPAVLVPFEDGLPDAGRDVFADPHVQRQARPGQPGAELLAAQE